MLYLDTPSTIRWVATSAHRVNGVNLIASFAQVAPVQHLWVGDQVVLRLSTARTEEFVDSKCMVCV